MHNLSLFDSQDRPISIESLERVFRTVPEFHDVRQNTSSGTPIEARFAMGEEFTTVRLSSALDAISISGNSDAAMQAALSQGERERSWRAQLFAAYCSA